MKKKGKAEGIFYVLHCILSDTQASRHLLRVVNLCIIYEMTLHDVGLHSVLMGIPWELPVTEALVSGREKER